MDPRSGVERWAQKDNPSRWKWGIIIGLLFLVFGGGCSTKPGYLEEATVVFENRWKVKEIDPSDLSEDEKQVYDTFGTPTYVRLFRTMDTREKVYEWVYDQPNAPLQVFLFTEGKRVADAPLDPNPSVFRESTRRALRRAGLITGAVVVVPILIFLIFSN